MNSPESQTPKRRVCLLGSTGSIGLSTLNVIRQHPDSFEVVSLSCGSSVDALLKQIQEFRPQFVSVSTAEIAADLETKLGKSLSSPKVFYGVDGHRRCVEESTPDVVMSAMMGTHGLRATLEAVHRSVPILGVANKEILVMAGTFILKELQKSSTKLVPVDSEHSAIFQALMGNEMSAVRELILTGSGGPFRTRALSSFSSITKEEALKHPNWNMGAKITIDSATMMNKGLEYIEALRLFGVRPNQVKIVVHPESVVHSLVEYCDGSMMAQLGISDMRIPIALALSYPKRIELDLGKRLDLAHLSALHFEEPDFKKFPCLKLAMASVQSDFGPVVLNAANEIAVERFLQNSIQFTQISELVSQSLESFAGSTANSLEDVIELDQRVKRWAQTWNPLSTHSRREAVSHETMSL